MEHTEASIEVLRDGSSISLAVIMPVWNKTVRDFTSVNIPLFGLKTLALLDDEDDIQSSIEEALKCFCIASEKFGSGIGGELKLLGWQEVGNSFEYIQSNPIFDQIMETGDQYANSHLALESFAA